MKMSRQLDKAFKPIIKRKIRKTTKGYTLQVTIPVEILEYLKQVDGVTLEKGDYLKFTVYNKKISMQKIE